MRRIPGASATLLAAALAALLRSRGAEALSTASPPAKPPSLGRPIVGAWPAAFPAKDLCSNCGLCQTEQVAHVVEACAFIGDGQAKAERLEVVKNGAKIAP